MPSRSRQPARDPKVEALRADGTLHRHATEVTDPVFATHEFFDPRDAVQVKYEMIRRVEVDAHAVAPTAAAFHFSRPSFYQAQRAFQQRGLAGLLPKKRGPRGTQKQGVFYSWPNLQVLLRDRTASRPPSKSRVPSERLRRVPRVRSAGWPWTARRLRWDGYCGRRSYL
jgi:hypothetical protein